MSTLVNNINLQEQKHSKKSYVSQPKKETGLQKDANGLESELKATWQDEHVLDDFRW